MCFRSFIVFSELFWDFGAFFQGGTKSKKFSKAASPKMLKLIQNKQI